MNHGPEFQKLWTLLRNEVRALQAKGYYGDGKVLTRDTNSFMLTLYSPEGMWSAGTRLSDSSRVAGDGAETDDLPEYIVRS
jgi:DNA-dependent metalloprotease WSS1